MYWAITQMPISLLLYFLNMITTFTRILFYEVYICIKFSMAFTSPLISVIDIFFQLTDHFSVVIIVSEHFFLFILVLIENTIIGLKVSLMGFHDIQKRGGQLSVALLSPSGGEQLKTLEVIWFKSEFPVKG